MQNTQTYKNSSDEKVSIDYETDEKVAGGHDAMEKLCAEEKVLVNQDGGKGNISVNHDRIVEQSKYDEN